MSFGRRSRRAAVALTCWLAASDLVAADPRAVLTADLPDTVLAAIDKHPGAGGDAALLLQQILPASERVEIDVGRIRLEADPRWFAAVPSSAPGAPFLEVRRWPGDSVLAFYALRGAPGDAALPLLPGFELAAKSVEQRSAARTGTILTPTGRRTAAWIDTRVPDSDHYLGTLAVPGDAGLGLDAVPVLLDELVALALTVTIRAGAWEAREATARDMPLALPRLLPPPSLADEKKDVWQSLQVAGFTLALPPGIRAVRLDDGLPAPRPVADGVLWMRGRFLDREGQSVSVGDGLRAGYVASLAAIDAAWRAGERQPLGARAARRAAAEDFTSACEAAGVEAARVERWTEPGFAGDWLVFRLIHGRTGIEIGLPVLEGRQSEALFWIPATWRPQGAPPAPPPMDPATRFGIAYRPLTKLEQTKQSWMEGVLTVPGLRVEVPRGWSAVANLRATDGFPVAFLAENGQVVGRLSREPAGGAALAPAALAEWITVKRPSKKSGEAIYRRDDGSRLFISDRGDGLLFLLEGTPVESAKWDRMVATATSLRSNSRADADAPAKR